MKTVMTGPFGMLGFWSNVQPVSVHTPVLAPDGTFAKVQQRSFARVTPFAANWNHDPRDARHLRVVTGFGPFHG